MGNCDHGPDSPGCFYCAGKRKKGSNSPFSDGVIKRVELVKTLMPERLPIGTQGTIIDGTMKDPGMLLIKWDNNCVIPMYRNELKAI